MFPRLIRRIGLAAAVPALLALCTPAFAWGPTCCHRPTCAPYCSPFFGYYPTTWRPWPRLCAEPAPLGPLEAPPPGKPEEPQREMLPPPLPQGGAAGPRGPVTPASFNQLRLTPYSAGTVRR